MHGDARPSSKTSSTTCDGGRPARAVGEHWNLESELLNRRGHAIDRSIVLARIPGVRNEAGDWPDFDLLCRAGPMVTPLNNI